jgi:hypothetical protein
MEEVMAEATIADLPVRLSATAYDHRLVRWYERLGFEVVEPGTPNVGMRWDPPRRDGG